MTKQDTAILQHWMKELITSPGTLQRKLQHVESLYELNEHDIVATEGKASVYSRLNVYTSGYVLRLLECLSADFPVLQKFIGDEVFYSFAKASLVWSPPVSYTLYDLGKNFIGFLKATRPAEHPDAETSIMLDLPIELAKLERARQEAMRAAGTEEHTTAQAINLEDILWQAQNIELSSPQCLHLLELKFPLKRFFEKVSCDEPYELPELKNTYMAVSRKNYRLKMEELSEWQYLFLQNCAKPISLPQAIEATVNTTGIPASALMADLYIWLPLFYDNGFLV